MATRTFAFFCAHAFRLPAAVVDGACAINLRWRGTPDKGRTSAYSLDATYGQLDVTLHAECEDDGRSLAGPEEMRDIFPLYVVTCRPPGNLGPILPVDQSWDVLGMEMDTCDNEIRASDCPPYVPPPPGRYPPQPRGTPGPSATPDCVIMGMEAETDNC